MTTQTVDVGACECFNIVDLPEEIRQKILHYLSFADLKSVCRVCRLEPKTKVRKDFTVMEKATTGAFTLHLFVSNY